jgi:hypothetical protein
MKRRKFLKLTSLTAAVAVMPQPLLIAAKNSESTEAVEVSDEPFLALQGSPFRSSCDGLPVYNDVSFDEMVEDIIHYRMPVKWQERFVLGIDL